MPASDGRFGADPYAVVSLGKGMLAGVLRGASQVVVMGDDLVPRQRLPAPQGAIGLAESRGHLFVAGELAQELWAYPIIDSGLQPPRKFPVPGLFAARAVAADDDRLFVSEQDSGRLLMFSLGAVLAGRSDALSWQQHVCNGPLRLVLRERSLAVDCLLDHQIVVFDVGGTVPRERARITQDGPFWGLDLSRRDDTLWIAATGAEDHPLDRTIGSFGYIDSFAYLYALELSGKEPPRKLLAQDVGDAGLVVPKVIRFVSTPGTARSLFVAAYGSAAGLELSLDDGGQLREQRPIELPPGSTAAVQTGRSLVLANALLDAWLRLDLGEQHSAELQVLQEERGQSPSVRLGEALLFTNLMAPFNESDGPKSRFSCETCHFEGGVDGRTHHTGRANVHATTKPLFGLFNNRPHFSRALDEDLSKVVHAEFRVAGARSGHDPVFAASQSDYPWLARLGLDQARYDPIELRRALMDFLMAFTPPSNPRVRGRSAFTPQERRGAVAFRDQCERCHAARASADEPASRQPFERWEALVFSPEEPLVWGSDGYQKTGVVPYVHELGARTPSLRRCSRKHPYFTNGTAPDLETVLAAVRLDPFSHEQGTGTPLGAEQQADLVAFLRLL
jgi:hypothetical protein